MEKILKALSMVYALISLSAWADGNLNLQTFSYPDFEHAKSATTVMKFHGKSTKLGLITTSFDGYAKKFSLTYTRIGDSLEKAAIDIETASFDTDSNGRNEKMHELCLESVKFPQLTGKILGKVVLTPPTQFVEIEFLFKGQKKILNAQLLSEKKGDKYHLILQTSFSLKEWQVADPSIAIAKVNDQIDLTFSTDI